VRGRAGLVFPEELVVMARAIVCAHRANDGIGYLASSDQRLGLKVEMSEVRDLRVGVIRSRDRDKE
jgi:hypothetical protein